MLKEFTDEIVNAAEDGRVMRFVTAAHQAQVPEPVLKEIAQDARFPAGFKKSVQIATPRVAAKWLNKAGISGEYADEVALVTALGAIMVQGRRLQAKLDELVALAKQPKLEPEKKP
jgi:hypothetical protein